MSCFRYAPESVNYGKFTAKSDVFSFGVTMWEIYSQAREPWGDLSMSEVSFVPITVMIVDKRLLRCAYAGFGATEPRGAPGMPERLSTGDIRYSDGMLEYG